MRVLWDSYLIIPGGPGKESLPLVLYIRNRWYSNEQSALSRGGRSAFVWSFLTVTGPVYQSAMMRHSGQRRGREPRAEIGMGDGDDKRAEKRSNVPRNFPKKTKYKSKTFNF